MEAALSAILERVPVDAPPACGRDIQVLKPPHPNPNMHDQPLTFPSRLMSTLQNIQLKASAKKSHLSQGKSEQNVLKPRAADVTTLSKPCQVACADDGACTAGSKGFPPGHVTTR